jgi:hypothetical protein
MSEEKQDSPGKLKAYEAPKLIRVSLRPEEAVLGHCKITGHAGPVSGSCMSPTACHSVGS